MKEAATAISNFKDCPSGIDIIGNFSWGSHFCQFYRTKQDLLDVLVPYFKSGLENGEFCVWVTSEFLDDKEAKEAMEKAVPGFLEYSRKGQMEIFPYTERYSRDGKFEMDRVLKSWLEKYEQGLAKGYCGLRVSGNPFWLETKQDWQDFSEYESNISGAISGKNILVLCTYSLDKCGANEVIDVVKNHQFALTKHEGQWTIIKGFDRENARQALNKSESRYRALFGAMTQSFALSEIVCDDKGKPVDYRYIEVNPAFEKFTGLKSADIIGKLRSELPIAMGSQSFAVYARVAETGRAEYFENYNETLKRCYNVYAYSPAPGKFATIFTDITERRKIEETLRQTKDYLESLFDYANAPIIVWNTGFDIVRFNRAFEYMTKYSANEVVGKNLEMLFPDDSRQESLDKINLTLTGKQWEVVEIPIRRKDGQIRVALWNSANIYDKAGKTIVATIAQGQDITERKAAEKRIEHLASFPQVNPNPIVEIDLGGKTIFSNDAAKTAFGPNANMLIPGDLMQMMSILKNSESPTTYCEVALGGRIYGETIHFLKNLNLARIYAFDITERKLAENKLNKLNRILKALSNANQALIDVGDEKKYLQKICSIIIRDCGYPMAWIGYSNNDEEKSVTPIACAGFEDGYLETLKITWADTERGQGPTGTAIRSGKPCGCSNMLTDPLFTPWRDEAIARGYASSLALPFAHGEDVFGVITIYACQPGEFLKDEVELLQELADDIANGVFSIRLAGAKKQAEDLLRESEKKFRQIADSMPNLVWIIDNSGNFEYVNLTFRNYTGVKNNSQASIWTVAPLTVEGRRALEASHKKALNSGQPYQLEQRIRRVDGGWRWYLTRCMPIKNSGGEVLKWYCTATDIHGIKQAQENLRHADEEKNKFISTMSHELRNPLTPIVTGIELVKSYLEQEVTSEEKKNTRDAIIRESVSIIDQQAKNMARLLDDMLDISRISRGKIQLKKEVVCLRDSLASAVEASAPLMKSQNHNFAVALPAASLFVFADPVRLQQVFVNLLNNAVKYTPPGGNIWLRGEREGNYARITVRDSGLGIDQETIKSIFSSFGNSRGITPFVSTQGELGIGLKLTKDLVNLHGGTISASSPGKNRGCEFAVKLPAMILGQEFEPDDIPGAEVFERSNKFRILIVDDNRDAADLCAKALSFFGHETKVFYDAGSALDAVESYRPQIMFVDIEMPGMNGYELAKKMREIETASSPVKLVAVTGYGQKEDKERARLAGFNMHLAKPVTMQTLKQAIDELMRS